MMNVIMVDDEPLALEVLETYISKLPNLNLVAKCNNAIEAFQALNTHQVDLMFLDIQMPQITGIDFLKTLANPPKVVFTTAYSEYAVDGYELNVVDYLLKPISFERFVKAIDKVILSSKADQNKVVVAAPVEKADYIFVKADKKLVKVRFEEIFYIEGLKDYVILHTPNGRIVTLQTMKSLERKLSDDLFMRIHRSYIINLNHIDALDGNSVLIQKKMLPVGKNYKETLLDVVNKNRL
ncbi:MAG: LytTR family DNA-binding domain-containing protein [Saprospiraceae bacterium]|nr:LytTR family DNA-binding domain-containing protein [Saprospiraceae bacterium]